MKKINLIVIILVVSTISGCEKENFGTIEVYPKIAWTASDISGSTVVNRVIDGDRKAYYFEGELPIDLKKKAGKVSEDDFEELSGLVHKSHEYYNALTSPSFEYDGWYDNKFTIVYDEYGDVLSGHPNFSDEDMMRAVELFKKYFD